MAGGAVCPFPPFEGKQVGVPVCSVHMDEIGEFKFMPLNQTRGFILFVYDIHGRLIDMWITVE